MQIFFAILRLVIDHDDPFQPHAVGLGGTFDVSGAGEFGGEPNLVPGIVFGVAVSEGIPVVGSGVDAPSVTPEIGFGIENDFAGDAVPVILFILRNFFEDEADSFFVACHVERGGTEAVFTGHNFVHAVGGGIFVCGFDGESLNGVRIFNDGTVENFGNVETAVIGDTDVVSGDVAELFGDNGEFFNQFKFLGEHFVTAFRFFAGEPADVGFDERAYFSDKIVDVDSVLFEDFAVRVTFGKSIPYKNDFFAVDTLFVGLGEFCGKFGQFCISFVTPFRY